MANYKVTIMGKDYILSSKENKDYTDTLAAALDQRIRALRAKFTSLTTTDCAVLTALDCMDELAQSNRNIDNIRTQIKDYVDDAGRARTQATSAQREIKLLRERIEQLEKELAERTNYSAMNNVGEAVSAEAILKNDIEAAIADKQPPHQPANPKRSSGNMPNDGAAGGSRLTKQGSDQTGSKK